ncbi:MAG: glutamine synthetase family protein [Oscillospiraceae bacterium]|nr:glutamine synthetase family protein [Oscillospiraceae bacterium]
MKINEVLEFVRENEVKFIRLSFCDILGLQKNISITADTLEDAFKYGVSFDGHAIRGFSDVTRSDLFLFPEPDTLAVLPWRPGPGRVIRFYCSIKNSDGSKFNRDTREVLRRVCLQAQKFGYECKTGAECEFYLFKTDDDGNPTHTPFDKGGYLDISPLDRCGDIRREICLTLEEMGIKPETSHHEQGPGQNEIGFRFNTPLEAADDLQTFKTAVKAIAARNGLYASFMPKPIANAPGNGMHVNLSLMYNGRNVFNNIGEKTSTAAESFIAGILEKSPEITAFLNPVANSYDRLGKFEAPKYVSWSHENRSQLVRIPAAKDKKMRMELRSPDPALNPYLAFALIIAAGFDGINRDLKLPPRVDSDLYKSENTSGLLTLPVNLGEAVETARNSDFVKSIIGEGLANEYLALKKAEFADFNGSENKDVFYREKYFSSI